jgi:hypothetical protein
VKHTTIIIAAGLALAAALPAVPAMALTSRSFVSPSGSDSNPCTLALPCRNLQAALYQTYSGGEIAILGTAGYSGGATFTIDRAISIVNPGAFEAGITPPSGQSAIVINAGPNDTVSLRGLTLDGFGSGASGIYFNSGAKLEIINSVIRNFTSSGIIVEPTANAGSKILVSNTFVLDNGNAGIYLTPHGQASLNATINNVTANHNNYGMYLDTSSTSGTLFFEITDSHADNNLSTGITLTSGLSLNSGTVHNTTASLNGVNGIAASGDGTAVHFSHCLADTIQHGSLTSAYSDGTNTFGTFANYWAGGIIG